jgi:hypothetical protein
MEKMVSTIMGEDPMAHLRTDVVGGGRSTMKIVQMKEQVLLLLEKCPLEEPLVDCPAKRLRGLSSEDRQEIVARMNPLALEDILTYHKKCMRKRKSVH